MNVCIACILVGLATLGAPMRTTIHDFSHANEASNDERSRRAALEMLRDQKIDRDAEKLTGQALVDYVNSKQSLWTAELNPKFESYSAKVKYGMLGVKHPTLTADDRKNLSPTRFLNLEIPSEFDARTQWENCSSIRMIRDQSSCGSCWAFGAVEAMSDRICIASDSQLQVSLSADDLIACCSECGFGCYGGFLMPAWRYWVHNGIVTGSNYTTAQGCKPYPFPPCEHHTSKTHFPPCKHDLYATPRCEDKCVSGYNITTYEEDKYFGNSYYAVEDYAVSIQKEIMVHGPVEAAFKVYEDFISYKSGVYKHTGGSCAGGHAVKLLGWGTQNHTPYWIAANSWNEDWGENGFFRILRGDDECGIESSIVAGLPRVKDKIAQRKVGNFAGGVY